MNSFEWVSVSSLAEATSAASDTVANAMRSQSGQPKTEAIILKAGGVDLLDLMKEGLLSPRRVINLHSVAELRGIVEEPNGSIRIGSMVTLAQLAEHPLLRARYPALVDAANQSASPQIRQVATIGGNLLQRPHCWYCPMAG